jgi:hypothetical protein
MVSPSREVDHVVLDASRDADDLPHTSLPVGVDAQVHDEVEAGGHGGYDEARRDVLAGQQRQCAHLHHRLPGGVGVQGRHPGEPGVQREQQVEALG